MPVFWNGCFLIYSWRQFERKCWKNLQGTEIYKCYTSCWFLVTTYRDTLPQNMESKNHPFAEHHLPNYPVILRILGFWTAPPLSRKIHHPWRPLSLPKYHMVENETCFKHRRGDMMIMSGFLWESRTINMTFPWICWIHFPSSKQWF